MTTNDNPPRYTTPYGSREIYRDGSPFVRVCRVETDPEDTPPSPTDVDDFARELMARYNAHEARGAYLRLHDGLSDMIEGGRLTRADIPDDYDWLVETLAAID